MKKYPYLALKKKLTIKVNNINGMESGGAHTAIKRERRCYKRNRLFSKSETVMDVEREIKRSKETILWAYCNFLLPIYVWKNWRRIEAVLSWICSCCMAFKKLRKQINMVLYPWGINTLTNIDGMHNTIVGCVIPCNDIICKTWHYRWPGWGNNWVVLTNYLRATIGT